MKLRCVFQPLVMVAVLFCSLPVFAQGPEPRLKRTITETGRTVLPNSRTPRVRGAEDLGAVSPDTVVPGITLVFRRSEAQEAALQELLTAQQNRTSPQYHQWLTPESFAARFGVADGDIAATESWLASHGFHVDSVARSRDRITFSGTAGQVQAAFGSGLWHYRVNGEMHFAPEADLTLPAELASVTAAVLHLSDFRPKPQYRVQNVARPEFTSPTTQAHYLGPKDIATMYDLSPLYQKGFSGAGQGLAVVGQSYVDLSVSSSVQAFEGLLSLGNIQNAILVPGSGVEAISPGDEGESEIDLEYSAGIAQEASTFLVYVGANQNYSVFDALAFAITENIAPVVSISYGSCEMALSQSELSQSNALFEEASAQGQTLVAAAGDDGSTTCAPYTAAEGVTPAQQQALSVGFPASSPYFTAVGGTQMAAGTFSAGNSAYWASTSIASNIGTLLSYVPEVVWNEGSASTGIAAGGGGSSAVFPRPTWQSGVPGITNGAYRLLPDISLQSSLADPGFLLCSSDPALLGSQGQTSSCNDGLTGSNNQYTLAGGTSFAAPIFTGFIAILNQVENATGLGNINPTLYGLAANPASYAAAFHDITSGTNACAAGAADCPVAGESNYAATVGYDEATGLGSVDFNALANAWPLGNTTNLTATGILITSSEISPVTTAAPGGTVPVQIYINDFSYLPTIDSPPTGSVSLSVDDTVVNPSLAISTTNGSETQGSVSYNFVAPATPGSHLLSVTYPGDAKHSPSTGIFPVLVGSAVAGGSISVSAGNLTVASGGTGSTQVTVTPSGGYNGRVSWAMNVTASAGAPSTTICYTIASLPAISAASTTNLTMGVGAACSAPPAAGGAQFMTPVRTVSANDGMGVHRPGATAEVVYAGMLMCGVLVGWRRRLNLSLLIALVFLVAAGAGLTGCGGNSGSTSAPTGPAGPTGPTTPTSATYSVTLTGKDSVNTAITASTTFTLTVN